MPPSGITLVGIASLRNAPPCAGSEAKRWNIGISGQAALTPLQRGILSPTVGYIEIPSDAQQSSCFRCCLRSIKVSAAR
jgi:hypothetical protein